MACRGVKVHRKYVVLWAKPLQIVTTKIFWGPLWAPINLVNLYPPLLKTHLIERNCVKFWIRTAKHKLCSLLTKICNFAPKTSQCTVSDRCAPLFGKQDNSVFKLIILKNIWELFWFEVGQIFTYIRNKCRQRGHCVWNLITPFFSFKKSTWTIHFSMLANNLAIKTNT